MERCKTPKYPLRCNYSHVPIRRNGMATKGCGFDSFNPNSPIFSFLVMHSAHWFSTPTLSPRLDA